MKRTKGVLLAVLPLLLSSCSYFLDLDSSSSSFPSSLEESSSSASSSLEAEEASFELRTPSPVAVVGDSFNLRAVLSAAEAKALSYVAIEGDDLFDITSNGYFTALKEGTAVIEARTGDEVSNQVTIEIVPEDENPYQGIDADAFYDAYVPATSAADAYFRSLEGLMSGDLEVPDKETVKAANQPKEGTTYVKNSTCLYEDEGATYCLLDAEGNLYEKIYRSGAYITLEEVAAYIYAFQELPPNYDADKDASPRTSMWGEYLRVNHSRFKGDTSRYPYEPELPHIDGCPGGYLTYYELDIGTTASGYSGLYNDGSRISRGAARIVYARYEEDGSLVHSSENHYLFYTYNHYNDFEEYLNYFGGWGVRFGKVTAGGEEDSSSGPEPTPYVDVVERALA